MTANKTGHIRVGYSVKSLNDFVDITGNLFKLQGLMDAQDVIEGALEVLEFRRESLNPGLQLSRPQKAY